MTEQEIRDRVGRAFPLVDGRDWQYIVRHAASAPAPARPLMVGTWRRRRVVTLAAFALALLVAITIVPSRFANNAGFDIVSRALAAVSQGPVLHAVIVTPTASLFAGGGPNLELSNLDLRSGTTTPLQTQQSFWIDASKDLVREVISVDGRTEWESLSTRSGYQDTSGHMSASTGKPTDLAVADFLEDYREALTSGRATPAGRDELDGRRVTWIQFNAPDPSSLPEEVAVDSNTGSAVAIKAICATCTTAPPTYRVATLEGLGYDKASFTLTSPPPQPAVGLHTSTSTTGQIQDASNFLGEPTAWLSPRFAGLDLAVVQFSNMTNYSTGTAAPPNVVATGKGVTLWYGITPTETTIDPQTSYASVAETPGIGFSFPGFNMANVSPWQRPLTAALSPVPSGGNATLSNVNGKWTVQFQRGSVFIEIEASGRELAISAARDLTDVQ